MKTRHEDTSWAHVMSTRSGTVWTQREMACRKRSRAFSRPGDHSSHKKRTLTTKSNSTNNGRVKRQHGIGTLFQGIDAAFLSACPGLHPALPTPIRHHFRGHAMIQEILVGLILALAVLFLFMKYRKSVKGKSCTCCGDGGCSPAGASAGSSTSCCQATGESVCHCHDK